MVVGDTPHTLLCWVHDVVEIDGGALAVGRHAAAGGVRVCVSNPIIGPFRWWVPVTYLIIGERDVWCSGQDR